MTWYLEELNEKEEQLRLEMLAEEEENLNWLSNTILEAHPQPWMRPNINDN